MKISVLDCIGNNLRYFIFCVKWQQQQVVLVLEQLFVGEVNQLLFLWTNLQLKRYSLIHLSVSCCLPCIYIDMIEYSAFQTPTHDTGEEWNQNITRT